MNEAHFTEIEKVLLYVTEAAQRAQRAAKTIGKTDAEPHLVEALEAAHERLQDVSRTLTQRTYFAVTDQERLTV